MAERPIESLTLREMLSDAERLTRELMEHLEQSFIPRCNDLARLLKPNNGVPPDLRTLEDVTIRTQANRILESETFTESVFEKLARYCKAIDENVQKIVSEGDNS